MEALLTNYSLTEILVFIVVLALAIKGTVSFYDWARERILKSVGKSQKEEKLQEQIEKEQSAIKKLEEDQRTLLVAINKLEDKLNMLIESDKEAIKSFIVQSHHYFCQQQRWIDNYNLECIEKRYAMYKQENGNSFVADLMQEIRALPKHPIQ